MQSVAFFTLGCKLNQFESASMAGLLEGAGFEVVDPEQGADIYIINTCTVTGKTDHRSRAAIRRAQRLNPDALIVVAGCYSKVSPDEIADIPGVHLIIGNDEKANIVSLVSSRLSAAETSQSAIRNSAAVALRSTMAKEAPKSAIPMIGRFFDYSRAFVKVQEGCDSQCAYCIIPKARGPNRSMAPGWVVEQVQRLCEAGYREVVLCGTHLGTYGLDLEMRSTFRGILRRILDETQVRRIRLSSIEPMEFDVPLREMIVSSDRICRHLHIPLQSGSDAVLKAMNRGYTTAQYRELVEWFKRECPEMCIGADVIVGFPAETEALFEETRGFIDSLPISYLHVFSYSIRAGTPADRLYSSDEQVPPEEIKRRSSVLRALGKAKRLAFHRTLVSGTLPVLILKRTDDATGRRLALSDNYVNLLIKADEALAGEIVEARIVAVGEDGVMGEVP